MPQKATPTVSGNRVEYQRGDLSEWYVNDSRGLEQGFTLARRPGVSRGGESLVIALVVSGDLRPELGEQGGAVLLRSAEGTVLRYSGLRAWDARGRALAAKLQVGEQKVRLVVEDHGAEYPLVVDPLWTQESELTAADGKLGDNFGWSVSVSGDTAVIGAYTKKVGSPQYFYNLANDLKPDEVVMQPWAKALQAEREGKEHQDDPLSQCMPPGVPRIDMSPPDAPIVPDPAGAAALRLHPRCDAGWKRLHHPGESAEVQMT